MIYEVKYRPPGRWFWKTLKIKGDGIMEGGYQARFFILPDESRLEIPAQSEVLFSKERFSVIRAVMEKSVGQPIPVEAQ